MLLTIDAGNTTLNIGIIDGAAIRTAFFPTRRTDTPDSLAMALEGAFRLNGLTPEIDGAVVCSVVPPLTDSLQRAVRRLRDVPIVSVDPAVNTGLEILLDNPAQLGADLAATAVGALAKYPAPCLVYDLGTATKISVLNVPNVFMGGVICPGVGVSLGALGKSAALLPDVAAEAPPSVIGANSVFAMQSGIIYGTAAQLDGLSARIEGELGRPCVRVATGGLAEKIVAHCRPKPIYDPHLIFEGMRLIYERVKGGTP